MRFSPGVDTIGGAARKVSSGAFADGRIAARAAVNDVYDPGHAPPHVGERDG